MTNQTLLGSNAYGPIVLSVLIAILASYTALDFAGRVTASRGRARLVWLVAGATSMGIGIWSMHFVGMLAFSLPVSIQYDWPIVLLSLPGRRFRLCSLPLCRQQAKDGPLRAFSGGVFMGGAIVALHSIAMDSMRLAAMCHYSPVVVALSVLLAIAGSWLGLGLASFFRDEAPGRWNSR
jgi:two-component system sensor histidine kinase/response regulator